MKDVLYAVFDRLSEDLSKVENKHNVGEASADAIPEHEIVADLDYDEKVKRNDQTGDVSGKIASLNDRFHQNQTTADDEIKGRWILGDDIEELPGPTKAAIKKKVQAYSGFEEFPLHDHGAFHYRSKDRILPVIWKIGVYQDDSLTKEADHPEDPAQSYRLLLLDLSDTPVKENAS
ncbi:hypothetical protein [Roseibium sp.]|uniref:hypothetical protein n=1 Tax=Roseibium sp. TaxID=1936156 RepID=UPI003B5157AE